MRSFIKIFLLCITGSMFAAVPAFGQVIIMNVDENGNGSINGAPKQGVLAPDPAPGGHTTLTYPAPFTVVPGDLFIYESDTLELGDIIRFNNNGTLVFYSDVFETSDALADTGIPSGSTSTTIHETGPEGANSVIYNPDPGQPGFAPDFAVTIYNITSDGAVPEPSTLALVGTGLLGLTALYRRRRAGIGA